MASNSTLSLAPAVWLKTEASSGVTVYQTPATRLSGESMSILTVVPSSTRMLTLLLLPGSVTRPSMRYRKLVHLRHAGPALV
jgi:hypothetical protein